MALRQSTQAAKRVTAPTADGGAELLFALAEHVTTNAASLALNDVIEMIPYPAGTIPISIKAWVGDIDTGTTLTLDFGILSGEYLSLSNARSCGNEFGAALTTGQAGGTVDVTADRMLGQAPSMSDRSIGFRVAAAAAGVTAGAKIRVAAIFAPVPQGYTFA